MKVELKIKQGSLDTEVTIIGYRPMVEVLVAAIKKAVTEEDGMAEVK